jgi:hypothetical protein
MSTNYQSDRNQLINDLLNTSVGSSNGVRILQTFPAIPLDKAIFGCLELNAEFKYGFSPDFDKNLTNVKDER